MRIHVPHATSCPLTRNPCRGSGGWELHPPCLAFLLCHPKMDTFPSVGQHAGAEPEVEPRNRPGSLAPFTVHPVGSIQAASGCFSFPLRTYFTLLKDWTEATCVLCLQTAAPRKPVPPHTHTHSGPPLCCASYSQSSEPAPA